MIDNTNISSAYNKLKEMIFTEEQTSNKLSELNKNIIEIKKKIQLSGKTNLLINYNFNSIYILLCMYDLIYT